MRCNAGLVVGAPLGDSSRLVVRVLDDCCHQEGSMAGQQCQLLQQVVSFTARDRFSGSATSDAQLAAAASLVSPLAILYGSKLVGLATKAAKRKQRQRQRAVAAAGGSSSSSSTMPHNFSGIALLMQRGRCERELSEQAAGGNAEPLLGFLQQCDIAPGRLRIVSMTAAMVRLLAYAACRGRGAAVMVVADVSGGMVSMQPHVMPCSLHDDVS